MSSVGNTYYSNDYGETFRVSDGSVYTDTYKPPAPVSVDIEEGTGSVDVVVTFNREIDKDTDELGVWSGLLHYLNGGSNINGTHEPVSFPVTSNPYQIAVSMQISTLYDIGGDVISYTPDGENEITGVNGIGTGSWAIKENNDFPNAQTAVVNINSPNIEVTITFDKDLDDVEVKDSNYSLVFEDFTYVVIDYSYPASNQWRTTWTKEASGTGSYFSYIFFLGQALVGANGVESRNFRFEMDGTSSGVTINE